MEGLNLETIEQAIQEYYSYAIPIDDLMHDENAPVADEARSYYLDGEYEKKMKEAAEKGAKTIADMPKKEKEEYIGQYVDNAKEGTILAGKYEPWDMFAKFVEVINEMREYAVETGRITEDDFDALMSAYEDITRVEFKWSPELIDTVLDVFRKH